MDPQTRLELEAATFRALMHHLLEMRPDVQNIDLMNLAGFCRNCLSRWYQEAAAEKGIDLTKDAAREIVYGSPMPTGSRRTRPKPMPPNKPPSRRPSPRTSAPRTDLSREAPGIFKNSGPEPSKAPLRFL
jgi:hypothetical protein